MNVPLLDLQAQFKTIEPEIREAVDRVISSQRFIMGPEMEAFEEEVRQYIGANHAIGVASGSDAILLAVMALDVGYGDAVITTPYSFFATVGSITRTGAFPIFVDIEDKTFNINVRKLEDLVKKLEVKKDGLFTSQGKKVKAIMPVHLFGQLADMGPIMNLAKAHGLFVIEDAAQAIGAAYEGKGAGTIGDFGCFSFFPSKNLGGFGDGGLVTARDASLCEKVKILRNHGSKPKYYHIYVGVNSRLDALQAAVLRVKLKHLDEWSKARRRNADRYRKYFTEAGLATPKGPVILPEELDGRYHIYNQFVIRCEGRDGLIKHLTESGVGSEIYYPVPLHLQECYKDLGYKKGDFPVSERLADMSLALPIYSELTEEMQQYVVSKIGEFFKVKP